jgi:hypothetical protein
VQNLPASSPVFTSMTGADKAPNFGLTNGTAVAGTASKPPSQRSATAAGAKTFIRMTGVPSEMEYQILVPYRALGNH